jgi:hypothetical protein
MALLYSKSELELIAQRLQCCAADAANEALAGEVFMDYAKKACGWNKFKFLKKASKILSEYVPGGIYTETGNLEVENTIDPDLEETFQFKGATIVSDITSPYYGFAFGIYGEPDTGETYMYVIYNGELHSVFSTADYSAPYMRFIQSIAYDHASEVLLLGASSNIQEYDLAPLLNTIPQAPTASSTTSFPSTDNFYAAYNRINQTVYFTNSFPLQIKKFFTYGNFGIDIPLGGFSVPSSIEVNSSNGEIWVVCGTEIQVVSPSTNLVTTTIDLASAFGATLVNKITYDRESDYFLVPWFDGLGGNNVALLKGSDYSVFTSNLQAPSSNPTNIYQAIYYQQLGQYVIGDDFNTTVFPDNYAFSAELSRTLLNDTKNNKVLIFTENCVVNPLDPFTPLCSTTPFRITVLSSPEEEVTLCLNDDDVQTIIETAQHHCCDCCPAPIIQLDYSSFSENPATEASEDPVPGTLYTLYYGSSTESGLAKLDPLELLTLTSINRYQYQGVYPYYVSAESYLYFAIPFNMGVPGGFFDVSNGTPVTMDAPYNVTYNSVLYKVYKSTLTYNTNISIQVI